MRAQIVLALAALMLVLAGSRPARAAGPVVVCKKPDGVCEQRIDATTRSFQLQFAPEFCSPFSSSFDLMQGSDTDEPKKTGTCSKGATAGDGSQKYDCSVHPDLRPQSADPFGLPCPTAKAFVQLAKAPTDGASSIGFLPLSLWRQTLTQLSLPLEGHSLGHYYDRYRDKAVLFFDAEGSPYFPMLDIVDEDDDIFIAIVDTIARTEGIAVSVQGCNRPPVEPNIYGGTIGGAIAGGLRGTERVGEPPSIAIILKAFGKCAGAASGGPQLVINKAGTKHTATIPVNVLYRLAVGLAFGYDGTESRAFAVRTAAGDATPRVAESKDRIGVATVVLVSFYPVARDFRKDDPILGQRLQVFVGTDTEDLLESLVLGVGYELTQGLNVLVGWRVLTKQPVLAEGTRLSIGSAFDGSSDALPTRERWEMGSIFIGAGLSTDLLTRLR